MESLHDKLNTPNRIKKLIIALAGFFLIFAGLLTLYILGGNNYSKVSDEVAIQDGWTIDYGNNSLKNVSVDRFHDIGQVSAGQEIVLFNKLPLDWNYSTPVIKLETHNCAIKIYINGKLIHEYGVTRLDNNRIVGSGFQYVDIKDSYKGKSIKIEIIPEMDGLFNYLEHISIADASNVYLSLITEYRIPFIMGVFLFIFGFFLMVLGLGTFVIYTHMIRLTELGVITLCVGVWTLCKYRLVQVFAVPMNILTVVEVMALYIGIVFLTLYFRSYVNELNNRIMFRLYYGLLGIQMIMLLSKIIADIFGWNQYVLQLHFIYYIFGLEVLYITVLLIMLIRRGYKQGIVVVIGFYIMVGVIGVETLNEVVKQDLGFAILKFTGLSSIGTIIFILVLIAAFAVEIAQKLKRTTQEEILYQMAYTDVMTNVYNRRYCEEQMMELSKQDNCFGIYNFDLNKLKETNDTLGHENGDRLIILFASALKQTFAKRGAVCRMGGDEFVVLIKDTKNFDNDYYLSDLEKNIRKLNQEQDCLIISASYGYADCSEVEHDNGRADAKLVYSLSDTRMYQYKQKMEAQESKDE